VDFSRTELGIVEEIVRRETRFLRHYSGKVLDNKDPLGRGRVLVAIAEFGHSSEDESPWAWPRHRGGQVTPELGEYVEVYFMAGDPARAVYIGKMAEMKGSEVPGYEGPRTRVLFSDAVESMRIIYDADGKVLKIAGGTQAFVRGDDLNAFLSDLVTWLNTHVHTLVTTGSASSGIPASTASSPSGLLSEEIKGE